MKKYLFICLLAVLAVGFTSCESENAPKHKRTIDLVVKQSAWDFDQSANMFYCHFYVPELTARAYNYGEVSINREYNSGTSNAYQVALPETTYKSEQLTDSVGNPVDEYFYYQQHIDYTYGIGFVEIFCTISDFYYEGFTPDAMVFRMQLTY